MNCKPNELAIVVGASVTPEMLGYIVRTERLAVSGECIAGITFSINGPVWVVSCESGIPVRCLDGSLKVLDRRAIEDRFLRPIRDNDGRDQTLDWAGLPEKEVHEN